MARISLKGNGTCSETGVQCWLRGLDLNQRPLGYSTTSTTNSPPTTPSHSTKCRVQRLPRYPILSGQSGLLPPRLNTLANLCYLYRRQRWLPTLIDSGFLREGNPLPLPLQNHRSLELGHSPEQGQEEVRHRRVLACEGQVFLNELNVYTPPRQVKDNLPEVIHVPRQPVHAMTQQ